MKMTLSASTRAQTPVVESDILSVTAARFNNNQITNNSLAPTNLFHNYMKYGLMSKDQADNSLIGS